MNSLPGLSSVKGSPIPSHLQSCSLCPYFASINSSILRIQNIALGILIFALFHVFYDLHPNDFFPVTRVIFRTFFTDWIRIHRGKNPYNFAIHLPISFKYLDYRFLFSGRFVDGHPFSKDGSLSVTKKYLKDEGQN